MGTKDSVYKDWNKKELLIYIADKLDKLEKRLEELENYVHRVS